MFDAPAYAEPTIHGNGDVRAVSYGSDQGLYVEFRMEDVYQSFLSEQEGKPVYKQVPFIRMYVPGDKTKVMDRPVQLEPRGDVPSDPQRFPAQWNAFRAGESATLDGFPLKEWALMTKSQVDMLHSMKIYTVEALSQVSDSSLDGLGHGGRALRDKAKAHLDALQGEAVTMKLAAQNSDLQRQLDELRATIEANTDKPRGPGRPRKEEAHDVQG